MKVKNIQIRNDGKAVKMQFDSNSESFEIQFKPEQIADMIAGLVKVHASLKSSAALHGKIQDISFEFSPVAPVCLVKELGVITYPDSGALDLKVFSEDAPPALICIQPNHVQQLAQVLAQSKAPLKSPKRAH